jgi:predicted glutamine amidotransferase
MLMCRLYGFRANEETKVECTLVHAQNALLLQSRADRRGRSHPDGWGIAFYRDGTSLREHRAAAAFRDVHFSATAERVYSRTVIAHIRMATVGKVSSANTHPFTYDCWTFAHNGTITAFPALRDRLVEETGPRLQAQCRGSTDSEQVFYWLLARMERAGIPPEARAPDLAVLERVVAESVVELARRCEEAGAEQPARLNVLLTDGACLVATRWKHDLYWVSRVGVHDCEICGIPHVHHDETTDYRAVVVASEPISREDWREVPDRSVLTIDTAIRTTIRPITEVLRGREEAVAASGDE